MPEPDTFSSEITGMTQQTSATPDYTLGFSEEMLQFLQRHTVEANSAFLIPYLRPGMRVLDFGCGPGTISVGLARLVAPGEMHGVDMEESQIDLARSIASSTEQDNAIFQVADATDLPFEDGYFDVAHCYNVLMHIPSTQAVLAEVKRGTEARRNYRQPRVDRQFLLFPPRLRYPRKGVGNVRGPAGC